VTTNHSGTSRDFPSKKPNQDNVPVGSVTSDGRVSNKSAQVQGKVTDGRTGRPIVGALVSVMNESNVETGIDGLFALTNVVPGVHQIIVSKRGYSNVSASVNVRVGQTTTTHIRLMPNALAAP